MTYASEYYDPVKAHEYYMRTRQLKGYAHRYDNTDRSRGGSSEDAIDSQAHEKYSSEVEAHTNKISTLSNTISNLRTSLKNMSKEEKKARGKELRAQISDLRKQLKEARQNLRDSKQRLKQNTASNGSTSGFNEKGKEAAEYIRSRMQEELESQRQKLDDEMLPKIKAYQKRGDISSGGIKLLMNEVKKRKKSLTESYKTKYQNEIDKLRQDDSMYTYWDKRNAS